MSRIDPSWIDSTGSQSGDVIVSDGSGGSLWSNSVGGAAFGRAIFSGVLSGFRIPHMISGYNHWLSVGEFLYLGTSIVVPSEFIIVASRSGTNGTAYCRLMDSANNMEIANISWTSQQINHYSDATLLNLPSSRSILDIQVKVDSGGSRSRAHSFLLV